MQEVGDMLQAMPPTIYPEGLTHVASYSYTGQTLAITFSYKPFTTANPTTYTVNKTIPTCSNVGYLTNYSGMNLDDVVTTAWLVVAVWVIVWSIKNMRRAL